MHFSRTYPTVAALSLAVLVALAFPSKAATSIGEACWPHVTLPAGASVMLHHGPEAKITSEIADPESTDPSDDLARLEVVKDSGVTLTGSGDISLTTGPGHKFDLKDGHMVTLRPRLGAVLPVADDAEILPALDEPVPAVLVNDVVVRPIAAAFWTGEDAPVGAYVVSDPFPGSWPQNSLRVVVSDPDLDFADKSDRIVACVKSGSDFEPAAVIGVKDMDNGLHEIVLALPEDLPFWPPWKSVAILVAGETFAGDSFVGRDGFWYVKSWFAVLVALAAVFVGHRLLRRLILDAGSRDATEPARSRFDMWLDWFSGVGDKASLSLFQVYLWSWLVFAGLVYVAVMTGRLFDITPQVLMLLGIAGVGSVSARFVAISQGRAPVSPGRPTFRDLFRTDGKFDIYKLQMFLFTVVTAAYVALRIVLDHAFPELDADLLLLLGISNGIYVGSKVASDESPFRVAERHDVDLKLLNEALANAKGEKVRLTEEIEAIDARLQALRAIAPPPATLAQQVADLEKARAVVADKRAVNDTWIAKLDGQIAEKMTARSDAIGKLAAA